MDEFSLEIGKVATHDAGQLSRRQYPGYGWCLRCGVSRKLIKSFHDVKRNKYDYMSMLCQDCWNISTPEQRLEYIKALLRSWESGSLYDAFSPTLANVLEKSETWIKYQDILRKECGL